MNGTLEALFLLRKRCKEPELGDAVAVGKEKGQQAGG